MAKQMYLPLFDDQLEAVEFLTDEQLGAVTRAAMRFMRNGSDAHFEGISGMFYQILRAQVIRQYGSKEDGLTGGRPKKDDFGNESGQIEKENRESKTPLFREENPGSLREGKEDKEIINSLSFPNKKMRRLSDSDFENFWKVYPRKESKAQAKKAFAKVAVSLDTLLSALETQKQSDQWRRDNGKYIPYASTWLNQKRWEDELPAQTEQKASVRDWTQEHPELLDQRTWVCGADGVYRPEGVNA